MTRATAIGPHAASSTPGTSITDGLPIMSRFVSSSCDMPGLGCRTSRGRRATYQLSDVALRGNPERHADARMSHFAPTRSDMQRLGCRTSRRSGATCALGYVAPHAREVQHRSSCSVAVSLDQGDVRRLACRTTSPGRATCPSAMGDKQHSECRFWFASHVNARGAGFCHVHPAGKTLGLVGLACRVRSRRRSAPGWPAGCRATWSGARALRAVASRSLRRSPRQPPARAAPRGVRSAPRTSASGT
jgi:hypothetical protein